MFVADMERGQAPDQRPAKFVEEDDWFVGQVGQVAVRLARSHFQMESARHRLCASARLSTPHHFTPCVMVCRIFPSWSSLPSALLAASEGNGGNIRHTNIILLMCLCVLRTKELDQALLHVYACSEFPPWPSLSSAPLVANGGNGGNVTHPKHLPP